MRFFLLDRITLLEPGARARGVKNVALSEDVFADHFPRHPTMPGVLLLEAMAQLGGILLERTVRAQRGVEVKAVMTLVERAKFRRLVHPGDRLLLDAEVAHASEEGGRIAARALVEEEAGQPARAAEVTLGYAYFTVDDPALRERQERLVDFWLRGA